MHADLDDRRDFDDANRGFLARLQPAQVRAEDGSVVYDADVFVQTTDGPCPDTVNPSLWRQSQLTAIHGLFEVTEGIYQIRGMDLSNMTLVEGDTGVLVIDPLISAEVAAAGLALYREHRGERAVTAVLYTHSHFDHFGGVLGVVDADTDVPIIAPAHFMDHAVSENVYAGGAMLRRGMYYTGTGLPVSATGVVGVGLGAAASTGSVGLLAPTLDITHTGQEETIDGVRLVFQMTPGTEAPSELNLHLPGFRALCMAENATHNLHNILTLRGAEVRDARNWSRYIAEAVELFVDDSDVAFASHHWPTWGTDAIRTFLTEQRDLYLYLHDQTLRMLNQGYVGSEIAERLEVPPSLDSRWHTHGYYGSVSHNVKAIYQRYLGWYDGNPAHLWQHPPEAAAQRYVSAIGGIDATVAKAQEFADAGDLRFAPELASHAVFAEPGHGGATSLLADVLTRLGYGAECATWRNCFVLGAQEVHGEAVPTQVSSAGMATALSVTQLFDSLAIRIDGQRAGDDSLSVRWQFTDSGEAYRMELSNGALVHHPTVRSEPADLTVSLTRAQLLGAIARGSTEGLQVEGDPTVFSRLLSLTEEPAAAFTMVTPWHSDPVGTARTDVSLAGDPRQDGPMEQSITVDIAAPPERVWEVLTQVETWSEWTPTVTSVRRLDEGPLRPGSRARISQPRIPETEYVVTELEPGRSFTWVATGPGVLTTARHDAEPLPGGGTRVRLSVSQSGWLGSVMGRFYRGMTDRYLANEANGLKTRCEEQP